MAWETRGALMVIVSGDATMTDDEFLGCCRETERLGKEASPVRILVLTGKGAPTASQRKYAADMGKRVKVRCATVAKHLVTRAVVNVFSLVMEIKAFKPSDLEAAATFLNVTAEERAWALSTLERLRRDVRIA